MSPVLPVGYDQPMTYIQNYALTNPPSVPMDIQILPEVKEYLPLVSAQIANEAGMNATKGAIRMFAYNMLSNRHFDNAEFAEVVKLVLDVFALRLADGSYARSPMAGLQDAVNEIVTKWTCSLAIIYIDGLRHLMNDVMASEAIKMTSALANIRNNIEAFYNHRGINMHRQRPFPVAQEQYAAQFQQPAHMQQPAYFQNQQQFQQPVHMQQPPQGYPPQGYPQPAEHWNNPAYAQQNMYRPQAAMEAVTTAVTNNRYQHSNRQPEQLHYQHKDFNKPQEEISLKQTNFNNGLEALVHLKENLESPPSILTVTVHGGPEMDRAKHTIVSNSFKFNSEIRDTQLKTDVEAITNVAESDTTLVFLPEEATLSLDELILLSRIKSKTDRVDTIRTFGEVVDVSMLGSLALIDVIGEFKLCRDMTKLVSTAKRIGRELNDDSSAASLEIITFLMTLNVCLTDATNSFLANQLGLIISIDDFYEDSPELADYLNGSFGRTCKSLYLDFEDLLIDNLSFSHEALTTLKGNYGIDDSIIVFPYINKHAVILLPLTSNELGYSSSDQLQLITYESTPVLYRLVDDAFKYKHSDMLTTVTIVSSDGCGYTVRFNAVEKAYYLG